MRREIPVAIRTLCAMAKEYTVALLSLPKHGKFASVATNPPVPKATPLGCCSGCHGNLGVNNGFSGNC